jgi:hypothetical protein
MSEAVYDEGMKYILSSQRVCQQKLRMHCSLRLIVQNEIHAPLRTITQLPKVIKRGDCVELISLLLIRNDVYCTESFNG